MVELVFLTDHAKNSFWWLNKCDEKRMLLNGATKKPVKDLSLEFEAVWPAKHVTITLKLYEQWER